MFGVHYFSNKKAWMTKIIFNKWLKSIDRKFKTENRQVILFVDNASSHEVLETLTNTRVESLPPNTTSVLQPLDQGIIWSFKVKYKKQLVNHLISIIRSHLETDSEVQYSDELQNKLKTAFNEISLKYAFNWITYSWNQITTQKITNCFKKAGFDFEANTLLAVNYFSLEQDLEEISNNLNELEINVNKPFMN